MVDAQTDGGFAWAMLLYELEDAQDGLKSLLSDIAENAENKEFGEVEFRIHMAHIYMHMNRAWNFRNATQEQHQDDALLDSWKEFPKDINPVNPSGS